MFVPKPFLEKIHAEQNVIGDEERGIDLFQKF